VNLLLDTNALLWWYGGNSRLGKRVRSVIARDAADVRVSAASVWEITIKAQTGRLPLREPVAVWIPDAIEGSGFRPLSVTVEHALAVASLPHRHADPFDRMLIAQAQIENLTIVTSDTVFDDYDVKVLDARR
jgi:PIN domain nuclease of toxin-antitoxin system